MNNCMYLLYLSIRDVTGHRRTVRDLHVMCWGRCVRASL